MENKELRRLRNQRYYQKHKACPEKTSEILDRIRREKEYPEHKAYSEVFDRPVTVNYCPRCGTPQKDKGKCFNCGFCIE